MVHYDPEFYRGKRVFVTGHTGFKGSWLCKMLLMAGAEVTGYSLQPPTQPNLFSIAGVEDKMHSVIGDIRDFDALKAAFDAAQPDIVLHLAAQPIVRDSYKDPRYTFQQVDRTHNVRLIGVARVLVAVAHGSRAERPARC